MLFCFSSLFYFLVLRKFCFIFFILLNIVVLSALVLALVGVQHCPFADVY